MTEEEIQALKVAKEQAEAARVAAEAAAAAAKAEAEKAKGALDGVVNELTEERRKKNEALSKLNINNNEPQDVNSLIEEALQKKEAEKRRQELEEAITEFKNSKSEFQNDAAGLVFDKFKNSLARFNLSDVTTKAEAKARLEEVYKFVNFKETASAPEYEGTPSGGYNIPVAGERVSKETESAVRMANMSEEKFKTLQSKYPDALGGLGI